MTQSLQVFWFVVIIVVIDGDDGDDDDDLVFADGDDDDNGEDNDCEDDKINDKYDNHIWFWLSWFLVMCTKLCNMLSWLVCPLIWR